MHSAYLLGLYQNNSFEADEVGDHGRYSSSRIRGGSSTTSSSVDSFNDALIEMTLDSSNGPDGWSHSHENQVSPPLCSQPMPPLRNSLRNLELSQVKHILHAFTGNFFLCIVSLFQNRTALTPISLMLSRHAISPGCI